MSHEFTRQELYDLVWSEPMQKLAKRFGLSDVGLAKACRSADIPRPGRGYWARLAAGKRVVKAALPPRGLGESDEVTIGAGGGGLYGTSDEAMASELIAPLPEFAERKDAHRVGRSTGNLLFLDVSFAYDADHTVLHRVSFAAPPGTRVGIRGTTGAGKSSLMGLLMRFYDPTDGQILLDGVDLRDYNLADLRRQFGIVLQEPVLFSSTIAENIAYGRPEATREQVAEAARLANAHEFISALPEGYDTMVGERGMRLSGGERQRISLARAFLLDAPILILDEPTSSVDVKTEAVIIEAMNRLMEGRTTFLISHRLDALAGCDMQIELEKGWTVFDV
jgi:ATP-binding cassette subfamily B protein